MTIPPPLLFLHKPRRGGRPRVHTTRCIRGSGSGGPELRWAQTSIFGIRLSANDRAQIFPSLLVGMVIRNRHNEIETDTNVNIILWIGGNLFIEHLNHADNIVKILFRCIK